MRALTYVEPDVIKKLEADIPVASGGEALVKVHFAGICGSDMAIVGGKHPRAKPPLIPGHEFAGEVVEIQSADVATDIQVGDRVTCYPLLCCGECWACRHGLEHVCRSLRLIGIDCDGAMAEYVKVPLDLLYKLPSAMPDDKGALIEPLAVGVHAVSMSEISRDDFAVVMGAGPIGLIVALCLREAGVETIVSTDLSRSRLALAQEFGFQVLNVSESNVTEEILGRTNGEGADVIFEVAGSPSAARQMTELVRSRGKIMMVSVHKVAHEVDLRSVNFKEITIVGTRVYSRADFGRAIQIAQHLPLDNLISHRIPIDDGARGFQLMKDPDNVCKVLISME